jgi:hypothetical protein
MVIFDITPKNRALPDIGAWGNISVDLPVAGQDFHHVMKLRELEREFHVRVRLDSIDIHKNIWSNDLMRIVYENSYPLRELLLSKTTVKISKEWLGYWEIYTQTIIPTLIKRMEKRKEAARERAMARANERKKEYIETNMSLKDIPVRTFHIHDNRSSSVHSMQKAINKVEFESSAQINWDWVATYSRDDGDHAERSKNKGKWTMGVDGEGAVNTANMRAWRNKIATDLKVVDIIIDNSDNDNEKPAGVLFALINLIAGGSAIIRIPRIASTTITAVIHIFSQCFENTKIIHTIASDRMYLCGESFLNNLSAKHHKLLYEFCDLYPDSTSMSPFKRDYISGEHFNETVENLLKINNTLQEWRYEYYAKLLTTYNKLYKSCASKTFTGYVDQVLDDTYHDESKKWIAMTDFNFFTSDINN